MGTGSESLATNHLEIKIIQVFNTVENCNDISLHFSPH